MSSTTASGGDSPSRHLDTPTLDREYSALLHAISEHGGYAYVSMAALAAGGEFRAAEAAREMAWEQLHSGPWHSVLPVWRDAYSMACLHVAKHHYGNGEFKEALRVLDMGIIMGGTLLRRDLDSAVEKVSEETRSVRVSDLGNSEHRLVAHDFDVIEVLQLLPVKSLYSKLVVKKSAPSLEKFLKDHYLSGSPVVISDCMVHWPAKMKWNDVDYLLRVAGDRTVPVEVGKNYLCAEWKQELITFSEFLQRLKSDDCSPGGPTYLAQHPLFDQINELRKDIFIPDYCFAGGGELQSLNAWFGPAGTVTPLHHDPHHNILAQVVGKKYIRLYSSSLSEELFPYSGTMLCNSSQNFLFLKVDLDDIDERKFPKVQDLEFVDCILEEGEMLYIPPKWWHYVRSLTTSLSVSFWWSEGESSDAS
ncbi:lysine-specific demethylase JMJ30-like isoform X2 [Abrus precatorius]|uniref:Lysine-specific demethylase JMJ30-like isoform X2 n=1 Tax=Abrus precatorius TaxID=3816 RepID=A0A8B8LEV9_ABRPR|nr:lysine-specific demethylase JMJ30-like isoform X2 [Abrus precatorius]XP_027353838.1 lysine-specific demethylase JMJ30-like isoform X2 [Abrus precatorius]